MKTLKLLSLFAVLFFSNTLFAQAPKSFKYQAIARDNSGAPMENQSVSFQISILQGSSSGTNVYTENHKVSTNSYGLVNMNIGNGSTVSGNFSNITWGTNAYYIQVKLDPTGGNSYQLMGTSQLLSVPYALYSETSGSGGSSVSVLNDLNNVNANPSTNQVLTWSGSQWIASTPVDNNTTYSAGTGLTLSGTTFSGPWTIGGGNVYRTSGNVGFGTASPAFRIHIVDTDDAFASETSGNFAVASAIIGDATGSNTTGENQTIIAAAENSTSANAAGVFRAQGTVGPLNIGVYGSASGSSTDNYAGFFSGDVVYTGSLTNISDKRLKTNIQPFTGSLEKLKTLNIYTYNYSARGAYSNMNLPSTMQYGFMAQDLEKIFPELVQENSVIESEVEGEIKLNSETTYKTVNHIGMVPILTKAIQEQQEIIEKQQELIEKLDARIKALENE